MGCVVLFRNFITESASTRVILSLVNQDYNKNFPQCVSTHRAYA